MLFKVVLGASRTITRHEEFAFAWPTAPVVKHAGAQVTLVRICCIDGFLGKYGLPFAPFVLL